MLVDYTPVMRDRPRMCGEHMASRKLPVYAPGSSPHVRGTHATASGSERPMGIIPACAGNTGHRGGGTLPAWDHPRMCGEHSGVDLATYGPQGSSPHVRGTPRRLRPAGRMGGIIPACAGNTGCSIGALIGRWDHPRMCGEHQISVSESSRNLGSSPHVRGTRVQAAGQAALPGIIPACAGNTRGTSTLWWSIRDHPRMCGEHSDGSCGCVLSWGSSPHVRGTQDAREGRGRGHGIIPACAGNTFGRGFRRTCSGDHPRMCGEHNRQGVRLRHEPGSSPHVRGTL